MAAKAGIFANSVTYDCYPAPFLLREQLAYPGEVLTVKDSPRTRHS